MIDDNSTQEEVIAQFEVWRDWFMSNDFPKQMGEDQERFYKQSPNSLKLFVSLPIELFALFTARLGKRLNISTVIVSAARVGLFTESWWLCQRGCMYHRFQTALGYGYCLQGRDDEAIQCLRRSWKVNPCPHLCSFGMSTSLYSKLREKETDEGELWAYHNVCDRVNALVTESNTHFNQSKP